ncbi:MAG TPA: hypothetical protein VNO81_14260 [Candidatus Nitrosotenuis sp.]|jgi:hypothetical protein|nr:hypothetical protein [Candidatus Nitrosotenuis sp.]
MRRLILALASLAVLAAMAAPAPADDLSSLEWRRRVAAADLRLASEWIAFAYRIPPRVPQEMLLAGHPYGDTLMALALMADGASLNRVLQLRARHRWDQVAVATEIDPLGLPQVVRGLIRFGRNDPAPPVLRFLPDVRAGLATRLKLPDFSPTLPSEAQRDRFRLNDGEVENIRKVLADPTGVPDDWLLLPAGRDLKTGDWVIAGTIAHLRPQPMDSLLEARRGQTMGWSDLVLAMAVSPDILTQGQLASIYPVLTGVPPDTILAGRRRQKFPDRVGLTWDLGRLSQVELGALRPLMSFTYGETAAEKALLEEQGFDLGEEAIALALARMAERPLATLLDDHRQGLPWSEVVRKYALDMTGQEALWASIRARESRPQGSKTPACAASADF